MFSRKMLSASASATALIIPAVSLAQSGTEAQKLEEVRVSCQQAFLNRDAKAYMKAAGEMLSWGSDLSPDVQREVDVCLAFADVIEGADPEQIAAIAEELSAEVDGSLESEEEIRNSEVQRSQKMLATYLERAAAEDVDMQALAEDIASNEDFVPPSGEGRDALEEAINAYVLPIPARQHKRNLIAYKALAKLDPENAKYKERIARYEQALEDEQARLERTARQLESRLIKSTAEFDGSSWSHHPQSPRYQDIRDYVTLYLLESASSRKSMSLFLNYTSRDRWLFVQSAQVNIDGEVERIPVSRWSRDNDTEIWEWGSVVGETGIELAREIANSDRTVIRFNGQQFYDDFVVSERDKKIMREMLAMWDIIKK